jgi:voltage-dependent calcium channel alpha-2/delta-4
LPEGYGKAWIKVGNEIQRNKNTGVNISEFFMDDNWKIHPDWVYCRYHYKEGHEFPNMEKELREFLVKIYDPDWKWSSQYEEFDGSDKEPTFNNCKSKLISFSIDVSCDN